MVSTNNSRCVTSCSNEIHMNNVNLESLYLSLSVRLKQFILKRVPDEDTANDILQEVFLKIHAKIDTLKDETKLESWIYQVTRNAISDYYRNKKPVEDYSTHSEQSDEPPEESANERILPYIKELVESLPKPYREALLLTEYEGMSQRELAQRLGLSFSGAKSRVQRARAMVRDLMMQCCHFEFDRYGTIIDYHPISCHCPTEPTSPK